MIGTVKLVRSTTGLPSTVPKAARRAPTVATTLPGACAARLVETVRVTSPPGARPTTVTRPVPASIVADTPGPGVRTALGAVGTALTAQS